MVLNKKAVADWLLKRASPIGSQIQCHRLFVPKYTSHHWLVIKYKIVGHWFPNRGSSLIGSQIEGRNWLVFRYKVVAVWLSIADSSPIGSQIEGRCSLVINDQIIVYWFLHWKSSPLDIYHKVGADWLLEKGVDDWFLKFAFQKRVVYWFSNTRSSPISCEI